MSFAMNAKASPNYSGARAQARKLVEIYSSPSIPVVEVAEQNGVNVVFQDMGKYSESVAGLLDFNEKRIYVNRADPATRQRFTIAHELAHYLLHRHTLGTELVDDTFYRSGLPEVREYEANKLAAEILMPWPLVRKLMQEGQRTPKELADKLAVSEAAVHIRLGLPT